MPVQAETLERIVASLAPRMAEIIEAGRAEHSFIPVSAQALVVRCLQTSLNRTTVWITDGASSLETAHRDMLTLFPDAAGSLLFYPARESGIEAATAPDPEDAGHRLKVLLRLARMDHAGPPVVIVTCVQALMQKTPPPDALLRRMIRVCVGGSQDLDEVGRQLVDLGYRSSAEVSEMGEFAVKGGLLDVWPVAETWPLRIEFTGSEIESIRCFDPADQRSVRKIEQAAIPPVDDLSATGAALAPFLEYLPGTVACVWVDLDSIRQHAALHEELAAESGKAGDSLSFRHLGAALGRRPGTSQLFISGRFEF